MSEHRSRPWQNPTPIPGYEPNWAGQFDSFQDWVNHATRAIAIEQFAAPAVCIDAKGRRCWDGGDFARARDENAFPVRYFWDFAESARAANKESKPVGRDWTRFPGWRSRLAVRAQRRRRG